MTRRRGRVVVVGGRFGGLQAVKMLARTDLDVTLIDRNNYHLFQPLALRSRPARSRLVIAVPLRQIFRREPRVRVVMGEVTGFDLKQKEKELILVNGSLPARRTTKRYLNSTSFARPCRRQRLHALRGVNISPLDNEHYDFLPANWQV